MICPRVEPAELQRLRESEEHYRVLIELSPQFVWTCRPDGSCSFVNQQFLDYTGLRPEQAHGYGWASAVHPEHRDRVLGARQRAFGRGERYEVEIPIRRADGVYRWFLSRGIPQRDRSGSIVRWTGISIDIDDRKQHEEALRDADRRKDEFLAVLGHELRNPLSAVHSSIALARRDPERRSRALLIARRQTRQLARLVDDLLDVARIRRGGISLRTARVGLARIVERAVEVTRDAVEERAHRLTLVPGQEDPQVSGDASRLQQVVVNLISNAARYTPPGGEIQVCVERQGAEVLLRVRDNGIGIAPEMALHIFDLFTQAPCALGQGGLGIGLSVVKRIVELHGGEVEVHSDGPGKGAEFVVILPAIEVADARPPRRSRSRAKRSGPRLRILVVEDNPDVGDSLGMFLEMLGNTAEVVRDGPSALDTARLRRPDLMLVDIGLPGMNGYELARRLRVDPGLRQLPLVALSGYGGDGDKEAARVAGFDRHFVKPIDLDALEDLVDQLAHSRAPEDS